MCKLQPLERLAGDACRHAQIQAAVHPLLDDARERDALEVLHREVVVAVEIAELEDLADVRVREARRELRLGEEHRDEARVLGEVRQDPLDHHQLLEAGGAGQQGDEHLAHAPLGELGEQGVLAEPVRTRAALRQHFATHVRVNRQDRKLYSVYPRPPGGGRAAT
jgi:hypothetical protein